MARITVEDCQERVENRFLLVQMTIKRVYQYREGYESLVVSRNKEVVTALREIAAGKILPEDLSYFRPADGTTRHVAAYDDSSYESDEYIVEVPDISADNARLAKVNAMNLAAYDKEEDEADDEEDSKAFLVKESDDFAYTNDFREQESYQASAEKDDNITDGHVSSVFAHSDFAQNNYDVPTYQSDSYAFSEIADVVDEDHDDDDENLYQLDTDMDESHDTDEADGPQNDFDVDNSFDDRDDF